MNKDINLKPCPFCGEPARWESEASGHNNIVCSAGCPVIFGSFDLDEGEMIEAWNRRGNGLKTCPFCGEHPEIDYNMNVYCENMACVIYGKFFAEHEWDRRFK